jgi:uncharacterized integral membrane protein
MGLLRKLTGIVVGLFLFCFAMLAVNQDHVAVRFLGWQTGEYSLFWWLLLAFVSGLLLGSISIGLVSLKHRRHERSLARQLLGSQAETSRLKAQLDTPSRG